MIPVTGKYRVSIYFNCFADIRFDNQALLNRSEQIFSQVHNRVAMPRTRIFAEAGALMGGIINVRSGALFPTT